MVEEEVLIKMAQKRDNEAFAKLIELYKNYVFAIILNFIKDYNEAENVAQEVFLQVYLSLPDYKADNFKGWLGRIASNKSIDWIRKKKSKQKEEVLADEESWEGVFKVSQGQTPEEIYLRKEEDEALLRICRSLPDIYEEVIINFYIKGRSYEEIAQEEGVAVKTVASRLYRGRNILKEKWREENEAL